MIKKLILSIAILASFTVLSYADLTEGLDYTVDYQHRAPSMADTLHINFITIMPNGETVIEIMQKQLRAYGPRANKNLIATAYHTITGNTSDLQKIKFPDGSGAYVWLGRSKRIVKFPEYVTIMKNSGRNRRR
jgi:hypothetical protein